MKLGIVKTTETIIDAIIGIGCDKLLALDIDRDDNVKAARIYVFHPPLSEHDRTQARAVLRGVHESGRLLPETSEPALRDMVAVFWLAIGSHPQLLIVDAHPLAEKVKQVGGDLLGPVEESRADAATANSIASASLSEGKQN